MAQKPRRYRAKSNFLKRCRCKQCNYGKYGMKPYLRRMNKRVRLWSKGGNKPPQFGIYTD